jgi:hypothetical protein
LPNLLLPITLFSGDSAGAAVRQASLYVREQWRINTVGLGVLTVAGLIVLAAVLWFRGPAAGLGAASTGQGYDLRLSHYALALTGTRERLFVLERWKTDSDPPSGASVNLLIVNSDDASSRWMFPDNGQTILSRDELHITDSGTIYSPVTGLVLTASNTAGESARESLYYYRIGGGPAVRFLTADSIVSAQQAGSDRYLVIYRNRTHTTAAVFSLVDFRVVTEKPVPDVP